MRSHEEWQLGNGLNLRKKRTENFFFLSSLHCGPVMGSERERERREISHLVEREGERERDDMRCYRERELSVWKITILLAVLIVIILLFYVISN